MWVLSHLTIARGTLGERERERGQYTNYTGCMLNMNLVYGLALCESSEYSPLPGVRKSQV